MQLVEASEQIEDVPTFGKTRNDEIYISAYAGCVGHGLRRERERSEKISPRDPRTYIPQLRYSLRNRNITVVPRPQLEVRPSCNQLAEKRKGKKKQRIGSRAP